MTDLRSNALMGQLGWLLAFMVLPLVAGVLLDRTFHSSPWFFLVGALIGILAGTVGAVRGAMRAITRAAGPYAEADGARQKEDKA